ncbi:hypothetical protein IPA_06215 [Ignicoccus pacificus DSM 13166]|uniref:Uncharacterized protein n=1 Tax=Ignicoccus pacificus DSM 13166 TaxID=940294 RepID=A0A977PLJ1_9CREN|nr:hypothetical protein IPA_06215 [Ignicoccus pacificus DSM 13166]
MDLYSLLGGALLVLALIWLLPPLGGLLIPPYLKTTLTTTINTITTTVTSIITYVTRFTTTIITTTYEHTLTTITYLSTLTTYTIGTLTSTTTTTLYLTKTTTITHRVTLIPSNVLSFLSTVPGGYFIGLFPTKVITFDVNSFISELAPGKLLAALTDDGIYLVTTEGRIVKHVRGSFFSLCSSRTEILANTLSGKVVSVSANGVTPLFQLKQRFNGAIACSPSLVVAGASSLGAFDPTGNLLWEKDIKWIASVTINKGLIAASTLSFGGQGSDALWLFRVDGTTLKRIPGRYYGVDVCQDLVAATGPSGTLILKNSLITYDNPNLKGYEVSFSQECKYLAVLNKAEGVVTIIGTDGHLEALMKVPGATALVWHSKRLYIGFSDGEIIGIELSPFILSKPVIVNSAKLTTIYKYVIHKVNVTTTQTFTRLKYVTETSTITSTYTSWLTKYLTEVSTLITTSTLTEWAFVTSTTTLTVPVITPSRPMPEELAVIINPYLRIERLYEEVSTSPQFKASFLKKPFLNALQYLTKLSSVKSLTVKLYKLLSDFEMTAQRLDELLAMEPTYKNVYTAVNLAQRLKLDYEMIVGLVNELQSKIGMLRLSQPQASCPKNATRYIEELIKAPNLKSFVELRMKIEKLGGLSKLVKCSIGQAIRETIQFYNYYTKPWLSKELKILKQKLDRYSELVNELLVGS